MKRLLAIIDYQNDFVTGALGFDRAPLLHDAIVEKVRQYKRSGDTVVYTMDTHCDDYLQTSEGKYLPIVHCVKGTPGWALYGDLPDVLSGCRCFEKPTFGSIALMQYCQTHRFDAIELIGLVSHICVMSNAVLIKAALPQADVIVDAACTAAADTALHEQCLNVLQSMQIRVINRTA